MKKIAGLFLILSMLAPWGMRSAFADDGTVMAYFKKIEEKQDRILRELETLKSELQIVKIRTTSR